MQVFEEERCLGINIKLVMRIVDLSFPIEKSESEPMNITIDRTDYRGGALQICQEAKEFLGISHPVFNENSFPEGMFISNEMITLSTHTGTHVDAPSHFGPLCNGKKSITIDECPLEWFYSDAVVLNFSDKHSNDLISKDDVIYELNNIQYQLKPKDIVLINTGTYHKWGKNEYFSNAPAMSIEATIYLIKSGVKVIGIDTYGYDLPFTSMIQSYIKTQDQKALWPNHMLGRKFEYVHIERLCNLDSIDEPFGFKFVGFPIKIKGADASWIRAVAIYN